jgi:hypothetical protein
MLPPRAGYFSTLLLLAALPGKNSRLRRSDSFPGGCSATEAVVPQKIPNTCFREMIFTLLNGFAIINNRRDKI